MAFPSKEHLLDVSNPIVAQCGLVVEEIKITRAGAKSAVKIAVDSADPTAQRPDLDVLEEVSKALSEAFDSAEAKGAVNFGPGYTLEVSTPGVDFPLTEARHWQRNVGRLATLPNGQTWRIAQVGEGCVALLGTKKKATTITVRELGEVAGAVVEVEFAQPPARERDMIGLDTAEYHALAAATAGEKDK